MAQLLSENSATPEGKAQNKPPYWFPRKRYGYGWGLPTCWQGWVVILAYGLSIWALSYFFQQQPTLLIISAIAASAALIWVCYRKGEPPKWSWGEE